MGSWRNDRLRSEHGIEKICPFEEASFLKPASRSRCSPKRLPLCVFQIPFDRLMIPIDGLIISIVDLDTVAIRIADIKEERVGDAMPARPALDVRKPAWVST